MHDGYVYIVESESSASTITSLFMSRTRCSVVCTIFCVLIVAIFESSMHSSSGDLIVYLHRLSQALDEQPSVSGL